MRLHCSECGHDVSTEIPDTTIVRAWIECPSCIEARPDTADAKLAELRQRIEAAIVAAKSVNQYSAVNWLEELLKETGK